MKINTSKQFIPPSLATGDKKNYFNPKRIDKIVVKRHISPNVFIEDQLIKKTMFSYRKSCENNIKGNCDKASIQSINICDEIKPMSTAKRHQIYNQKEIKSSLIIKCESSQNIKEYRESSKRRSMSSILSKPLRRKVIKMNNYQQS